MLESLLFVDLKVTFLFKISFLVLLGTSRDALVPLDKPIGASAAVVVLTLKFNFTF